MFGPMTLEVSRGADRWTWVNKDDIPHVVCQHRQEVFKRGAIHTDGTFMSITFADAGTYEYYCWVHPKMTGKIVVK